MVTGNDGGLWISYDGGARWNKSDNLPISQFYHVSLDDKDPYQVYGGLQDNSAWVGDSAYPGGISNGRWENLGGGDGFWAWADPADPEGFAYVESQGGSMLRVNRKTLEARDIQPRSDTDEKLRFNWNTPIALSPNETGTIYIGAQYLFRSRDHGQSWDKISPDLTTNDKDEQKQEESRRRHRRQLRRRDPHDDLRRQRVAAPSGADLGRDRRRQRAAHPRRRQELDQPHRQPGPAAPVLGVVDRGQPLRAGHGLRRLRPAHLRRHGPARLPDHRLRPHLDAHRAGRRRACAASPT